MNREARVLVIGLCQRKMVMLRNCVYLVYERVYLINGYIIILVRHQLKCSSYITSNKILYNFMLKLPTELFSIPHNVLVMKSANLFF